MKLRLEVRKSSAGSSNPVTGGFSGLRIGEFCWPKAGAGAVSAGCVVVWAARFILRPTIRNTVIRIFFMLFTRGSLLRVFCANRAAPTFSLPCLRHDNRVPRLQQVVMIDLFTLDQFVVVH